MTRKIKRIFYKLFGKFLFNIESHKRKKLIGTPISSRLENAFRALEASVSDIRYPDNEFNKFMSMVLSDIKLFDYVVRRFRFERRILRKISFEDEFYRNLNNEARSFVAHPYQRENDDAIKMNTQALFIFGMILIYRSLGLLRMYLGESDPDMFKKIPNFYNKLSNSTKISSLCQDFRDKFILKIKWLYSVLRFYRNEFIEHLDRGYQQGMNFSSYMEDFALSSYKWNYSDTDNENVEKLREKLEKRGVQIPGRNDGGRNLINRFYIQKLFENIILVPNDLLNEALKLIEEIGVHSPQPEEIISGVESYIESVFQFMIDNIDKSEIIKYKVK